MDQTLSRSNRQHPLGTVGFARVWFREPHCGATQRPSNQSMLPKSIFLVAAFLQVALLGPTSAADSKSDECGLASVYSTGSEETASGEDTQPENFTAAHRSLPFGTLVHVNNQENGIRRSCGSPIVALSPAEE
jgi:rare lipoprotein A (peptidoglycan hydrolase)